MKLKNICRIVYSPKKSEEPPSAHKAQSEGVSVEKDKTKLVEKTLEKSMCVCICSHTYVLYIHAFANVYTEYL